MNNRWSVGVLLAGLGVSALGDQVNLVALNVWVLNRTHSPLAVSGLWLVPPLAGLLLGSIVGGLADRWDRRLSLIAANLISAVGIGLVPLLTHMLSVYAAIFVVSAANALFLAALASYIKMLVPRAHWARVSALRGILSYGTLVMGPALAGLSLIHGRPRTAIWLDAVSFLVSAITLLLLPRLNPMMMSETHPGAARRWLHDLIMVKEFFRSHRVALGVMGGFMGSLIFGSAADAQEVVFARRALHLGQSGYGLLVMMAGMGYAAGSAVSYLLGQRVSPRLALGSGIILSSASYLYYSRSATFWEAAVALICLGIFQSIGNVGFSVYLQEALPTEAMGRIMATVHAIQSGLLIVAIILGGVLSHSEGVRWMMTAASLVSLLVSAGLSWICLGPGASRRWSNTHKVSA